VRCGPGGQRDALLYAISEANGRHGAPLTLVDRRKAAQILIDDPEWSLMSDRDIARHTGLHHTTVANMRPVSSTPEPRTGADGKVRKLPQRAEPAPQAAGDTAPLNLAVWEKFVRGTIGMREGVARSEALQAILPTQKERDAELKIADVWQAEAKKAKRAKQAEPPLPPAPAHYLPSAPAAAAPAVAATASAAAAQAAATTATTATPPSVVPGPTPSASETPVDLASAEAIFAEATRLGQVDAADSAPRSEAELWQALGAFAGRKIPKEPRPALRTAYLDARAQAQRPTPGTFPGLFEDSPLAGLPLQRAAAPLSSGPAPAHEMQLELGDEEDQDDEDEDDFDADVEALNITPVDLAELAEEDGPRMTALDRALNSLDEIQAERDALRRELAETRALADRLRETGRQRFAEVDEAREQAVRERDAARAEAATLRAALIDTEAERDAARAEWAEGRLAALEAAPRSSAEVLCEADDCTTYVPRPVGGGLALCERCRPSAAPSPRSKAQPAAPRTPAEVLGDPNEGQHLGGAPDCAATWLDLGRGWGRWYFAHTTPADRKRQAYGPDGIALYVAERLLQAELDLDTLPHSESSSLYRGILEVVAKHERAAYAAVQPELITEESEPTADLVTVRDEPPKKTRAPRKARKEAK
jgi:hypothetical protein